MPNDLTLWGVRTSRTMRAHWMLAEMGLEYECRAIGSRTGETLTPEFLKLNPRHKIPVLQHGSRTITESAAIAEYLSETFAPPADFYVPRSTAERAKLHEWCYFVATELDAAALYLIRKHKGLKDIYGEAPQAVTSAQKYFSDNLEAMEPMIVENGDFLFGDRFSIADILLMTCLDWAAIEGISLPHPIEQYRRRVALRPA